MLLTACMHTYTLSQLRKMVQLLQTRGISRASSPGHAHLKAVAYGCPWWKNYVDADYCGGGLGQDGVAQYSCAQIMSAKH